MNQRELVKSTKKENSRISNIDVNAHWYTYSNILNYIHFLLVSLIDPKCFSHAQHVCVHASVAQLCPMPCNCPMPLNPQAPLSMEFSRQEYQKGVAISSSMVPSWPRGQTLVFCISALAGGILYY